MPLCHRPPPPLKTNNRALLLHWVMYSFIIINTAHLLILKQLHKYNFSLESWEENDFGVIQVLMGLLWTCQANKPQKWFSNHFEWTCPYRFPITTLSYFNSSVLPHLPSAWPTSPQPIPKCWPLRSLPPPSSALSENMKAFHQSSVIEWAAHAVSRPVALVIPISGWQERKRWRVCVCMCVCVAEANIPGYYPIPYLVIKMNITLPMRGQPQEWTHTCDRSAHICCMHIYVYTHTHTHSSLPRLHDTELSSRELTVLQNW